MKIKKLKINNREGLNILKLIFIYYIYLIYIFPSLVLALLITRFQKYIFLKINMWIYNKKKKWSLKFPPSVYPGNQSKEHNEEKESVDSTFLLKIDRLLMNLLE